MVRGEVGKETLKKDIMTRKRKGKTFYKKSLTQVLKPIKHFEAILHKIVTDLPYSTILGARHLQKNLRGCPGREGT